MATKQIIHVPSPAADLPDDYDAFLSGQYIGSFPTEDRANQELNLVAYHQRRSGLDDVEEPSPRSTTISLAELPFERLKQAAERLEPDPAIKKALKRLEVGDWTAKQNEEGVVELSIPPSSAGKKTKSSYTTTPESCCCLGYIFRGGCYHPIMAIIVSEALDPTMVVRGAVSLALLHALFQLALAADVDVFHVRADSVKGTLSVFHEGTIAGRISLSSYSRVRLNHEFLVARDELVRLAASVASLMSSDISSVTVEMDATSFVVQDEMVPFCDGLSALVPEEPTTAC